MNIFLKYDIMFSEVVYMKLLIKDNKEKLYLQISDIIFIFQHELNLPDSVKEDFNEKLKVKTTKGLEDTPYTFKLFTEPDTIAYVNGLAYIVNYNEKKQLTVPEIYEEAYLLQDKKQELAVGFNKLSLKEREKKQDVVRLCDELDFRILSLRDLVWFKEGSISMIIPGSKKAKKTEKKLLKQQHPKI